MLLSASLIVSCHHLDHLRTIMCCSYSRFLFLFIGLYVPMFKCVCIIKKQTLRSFGSVFLVGMRREERYEYTLSGIACG